MNYDQIEQAGYEIHLTCRGCGCLLKENHTIIMGVCSNCIRQSNDRKATIPRPKYRIGRKYHHGDK